MCPAFRKFKLQIVVTRAYCPKPRPVTSLMSHSSKKPLPALTGSEKPRCKIHKARMLPSQRLRLLLHHSPFWILLTEGALDFRPRSSTFPLCHTSVSTFSSGSQHVIAFNLQWASGLSWILSCSVALRLFKGWQRNLGCPRMRSTWTSSSRS